MFNVVPVAAFVRFLALCACFRIASSVSHQSSRGLALRSNRSHVESDVFLALKKPPRIFRTGTTKDREKKGESTVGQQCGVTVVVGSSSNKDEVCPSECPFYVQDKTDNEHCSFACVPADQCTKYNPMATVPDPEKGACRPPTANFCREYDTSGLDKCAVCKRTYKLDEYGQCHFEYIWMLYALAAILVLVTVLLLLIVINMGCRAITNKSGMDEGLQSRSAQKLHRKGPDGRRRQWPLDTNMLTTEVAGPGMLLHFNFQLVIIIWAFGVAVVWTVIAYAEDPVFDRLPNLMRLGTRRFGMPRENCIMVAWGYETQMRLMWVKVAFLAFIYVGSFALAIYHGVRQLRLFETIDRDNTTMTDFAVMLSGLPLFKGTDKPEERIKEQVQKVTGQEVVGVSIAWDFLEDEERVMKEAKGIVYDIHKELDGPPADEAKGTATDVQMSGLKKQVYDLETYIFAEGEEEEEQDQDKAQSMRTFLDELHTTEFAFVVFKTEASRNAAMEKVEGSFEFDGQTVTMEETKAEPDTVQWQNFGHSDTSDIIKRLALGFGYILLGLVLWTVCFYGPYTWSIFNFNYENGNEPGFMYGFAFSMVVVVGNAIMYEICARVSDMVGFHFRDNRETCYMILYTIACTFNVLLDFVTTYYIVFEISKGLGFRSYHGEKLSDIDSYPEQFETYAMQRLLGENTYSYAFPSTYLIPFLIEPFVTIYAPLKAGMLIVRSHPEIRGSTAEEWLAAAPMDMGRYADCLLDVVLAVLVLYFPGGWTWQLYFALAFCHMFIYAFDHWKVLRNIPACTYASMDVDWWSQAMFAPCIAMILSCLIFKANGQGYGFDLEGWTLLFVCTAAWVLHCVVHILLLVHVVPMFGSKVVGTDAETNTFQDCASATACSWFTANPVHCLRSKYTFGDEPECILFLPGKEHCQKVNEKIGVFFTDTRVDAEDYDDSSNFAQAHADLRKTLSKSFSSFSKSPKQGTGEEGDASSKEPGKKS